jgi:hypothetical protein
VGFNGKTAILLNGVEIQKILVISLVDESKQIVTKL